MKLKSIFSTLAILTFGVSFSQTFEVKSNSSRQIKDSIIITDTFILRQNSILTFASELKSCNINCNVFISEKGATILGNGTDGKNGVNAVKTGASGSSGGNGNSGIRLKIQASVFSYCDLIINLSGGNGGIGGNGLKGKKGRNASCCTAGAGDGGSGGNGGDGGNGGNGGSLRIKYTTLKSTCGLELGSSNFILTAGKGNNGGKAGAGGDGGNSAHGCAPGCNQSGGSRGSSGSPGTTGQNGTYGSIITE